MEHASNRMPSCNFGRRPAVNNWNRFFCVFLAAVVRVQDVVHFLPALALYVFDEGGVQSFAGCHASIFFWIMQFSF